MDALRQHVIAQLTARQAHRTFDDVVTALPAPLRGTRPENQPYSVWELVEHIRRAQHDILVYCQDPDYEPQAWPDAYWPDAAAPSSNDAWTESLHAVQSDRQALVDLVQTVDLYDTVPSHNEHTYLREALLVADHTAYHVGQIVSVRRALDAWPPEEE
jgi:hypothetical protein